MRAAHLSRSRRLGVPRGNNWKRIPISPSEMANEKRAPPCEGEQPSVLSPNG